MPENPESARRVALVTGAARGIGAAVSKRLAADGCDVIINCHSQGSVEAASELAESISKDHGVRTAVEQCDVSGFDAVKDMVDRVKEGFGRIDILVNNAGITRDGLLMRMKAESFEDVIDTNLVGAFNCLRHVAPIMIKQRSGRVVSISSVVGIYGNAGQVNYAASKAGIIGMTKAAAKELGSRGITVNAIAPGFIETAMTDALDDKAAEAISGRIALGRLGNVQDVANAVSFLASNESSYITGQVLAVDGGISL